MKRILAYFFLFIFSFQVLPVKAIGKILAKNQMTEEVKSDCDVDDNADGDEDNIDPYKDFFCHHHDTFSSVGFIFSKSKTAVIHVSDDLPKSYIREIHCPPPNC